MHRFFHTLIKIAIILSTFLAVSATALAVTYKVPLKKSILLQDPKLNLERVHWKTSNELVATVSQDGIAYAEGMGAATIDAIIDESIIASYGLTVTEPEPLKNIFIEPNNPSAGSKIEISAITLSDIKKIKFTVIYNGQSKEHICKNKKADVNNCIFSAKFVVPDCDEFFILVSTYKDGKWQEQKGKMKITVSKSKNEAEENLSPKRVSKSCINFIMACEGIKTEAKKDSIATGYVLEVGYGDTINFGQTFYSKITPLEAYASFLNKINGSCTSWVNSFLISNGIKFNQQQFDALVSLTYNIGYRWMRKSSLRDIILKCKSLSDISKNSEIKVEFIKHFLLHHHANKKCYKGLLYRRIDELEIFFFNDYKRDGHLNRHKFELPECIIDIYGKFM